MSWDIKGKDNTVKATVYALEYNGEWMGESYVSVTIESPTPIAFAIGDYLMYRGERFEINYDPGKIKSAPQFAKGDAFKYENVKFNSLSDELTRCDFLDVVLGDNQLHFTGLPKFSFYGGVRDLANRIQANLNRAYPNQWTVVVSPEYSGSKELNVSVDTQKVWDALSILVNDFETYFTIKGRTITIGAAGVPAGHLFKYGKGNGLYEIEQNAEADQAIVTRLRAYGSTRNLPHRYYNSLTGADGQKLIPDNMAVQYLMLPSFPYTTQDPYIDSANKVALGIREGTIFFDGSQDGLEEIYPSIEGMTAEQLKAAGVPCNSTGALDVLVSAEQMTDDGVGDINEGETETTATPPTFKVTLKDLGFDINDHLTTEAATLSFKTGMLGGRDFEIVDCKKEGNNYVLELNRVYDDSIKLWFPYKDYNAKGLQQNADNPDKFVLLHIEMPEVYIKAAAQRLLEAATAWLAKNDYSRSVYTPKVDEIFMARQHDEAMASGGSITSLHDTLKEGMLLLFEDDDLNIDASIFIDRLTIKEGDGPVPTYEVVLKEEKTVGRLDKMQNQIDSLAAGGGQGGGYSASQIRSLIDAYGGLRFLSKLKDDRSKGKIASDLGFEIGNYLAGVSGGIFGIDADNGDSFAEVARLFVRGKAYFETLTTMESKTLAGKQYISPGGSIKCTKVEELKNPNGKVIIYRCYFLSEQDGEKTETKIIAGDQAISEMFNAKTGVPNNKLSNHRYWRLVTSVNNDAYSDDADNHYGYIDLSAVDCKSDSDIPKEGDVIEQFGNRTDAKRQSAMVFSTVDADAPSIKMFAGIGSGTTNSEHYSLNNKAIISFGRDAATGKVYFRLGATDATQFLDYKQDEGLTLNGKLSVNSTIGDKTIDEYFADKAEAATDKYKYLAVALPQDTEITGGVMLSTLVSLGYTDASNIRHTLAGMNGGYVPTLGGRTIGSWWGGPMVDLFDVNDTKKNLAAGTYATSMVRMDGSAYFLGGDVQFRSDKTAVFGSGDTAITIADGRVKLGNGILIDIGGEAQGLGNSIASVATLANELSNLFTPYNGTTELTWQEVIDGETYDSIKANHSFWTEYSLAGKGLAPAAGSTGGGGGSLFGLYTDTTWVSTPAESDALSAVLGKSLHARVSVLEGAGFLTSISKQMVEDVLTGDITSHTHNLLSKPDDTRSVATTPNDYNGKLFFTGMKRRDALNVPGTGDYANGFGWRGWGDSSGGKAWEVFGDNADLYIRCGSTTTWEAWRKILTDGNYASTLDGRYIRPTGTASQFLMADGSVTTKVTASNLTTLGWTSDAVDALRIPNMNLLAYWNGCFSGTLSNLQYCDRGRFGTMAVADAADYVTVATAQSISGVKTFTNGFRAHYEAGTWLSMATRTSQILADQDVTSGNAHSLFMLKNINGSAIAYGGLGADVGFYGFTQARINAGNNGTDWRTTWNVDTGALTHTSTITASHFIASTTNICTNLNANYLGGYTLEQVRKNVLGFTPTVIPTSSINCDLNLLKEGMARNYWSPEKWVHAPEGFGYGAAVVFAPFGYTNLHGQLAWDVNHLQDNVTRNLYWRVFATATGGTDKWGGWRQIAFTDSLMFAHSSHVGNVDLNTITTSGIYGTGGSCTNAPDKTPYGQLLVLHGQGDTPIAQMMFSYNVNGLVYVRSGSPTNTGGSGKWGAWKQLALMDSNVASATKLQTARSIWGQSFDGTAAISGELQHVTAIRFDSGNALVEGAHNSWNLWSNYGFMFYPSLSSTVSALTVQNNGRVGVNMYAPAYDFDVTGVIHASGEIFSNKAIGGKGMTSSSDIRQKHIIGDFVMSLDDVLKMPLKRFKWLDGPDKDERIGVIAQEALKIVPQVVYLKPDGFYGVDYGALAHAEAKTAVRELVEQRTIIAKQGRQIKKLEKLVQKLQQKIHA